MTARLTITVRERFSDPDVRHPRQRTAEEVEREFPDPARPKRLLHERKGQRFRPHGTDSVGRIVSHPRARRSVQFIYRHDPDTLHSMPAHEFTDRFAVLIPLRKHRPAPAGVRQIRPTPQGIVGSIRGERAA